MKIQISDNYQESLGKFFIELLDELNNLSSENKIVSVIKIETILSFDNEEKLTDSVEIQYPTGMDEKVFDFSGCINTNDLIVKKLFNIVWIDNVWIHLSGKITKTLIELEIKYEIK